MAPFSVLLSDGKKMERLRPGAVIYCVCPSTTPPKNKFQLVCNLEPLLVLLINSKVNQFITNRPDYLRCQVELLEVDYEFLRKDSHLNCVSAHDCYDLSDMKGKIVENYTDFYQGDLLPNDVRDVIAAVNDSIAMPPIHQRMITASLNTYLTQCD